MTHQNKLTNLKKRSLVIQSTRDFFMSKGFLEVETPILSPAVIPEAHIDPVTCGNRYLQASPELYMKRLLAQGADRIFQICKCFRKGERGSRHLPELTMLEWYGVQMTYTDLMDQCEGLIHHIADRTGTGNSLVYQGRTIELHRPFERLTVEEAFQRFAGVSPETAMEQDRFDEILSFDIEPYLGIGRPCILYDYPSPLASLAKLHEEDCSVAQRFELYIAGLELANGFTELTDANIQHQRFQGGKLHPERIRAVPPAPAGTFFV